MIRRRRDGCSGSMPDDPGPATGPSRFWAAFFPRWYRIIRVFEPLLRRWLRRYPLGDTVELTVVGRRSGRPRRVLLGLLTVGDAWYLGHPAGMSEWTANLEAAGTARLAIPKREAVTVRAVLLTDAVERERAIRATFRQHPFPGNVLYWLAREHVRAVGRLYRLEPTSG